MNESQNNPAGGRRPHERVAVLVGQILGRADDAAPLPVNARLNELGMSSMKMINLMLAIEFEFDLAIPQVEITPSNFESIASVQALLVRLLELTGGV
jgi:acyl carrier protein